MTVDGKTVRKRRFGEYQGKEQSEKRYTLQGRRNRGLWVYLWIKF